MSYFANRLRDSAPPKAIVLKFAEEFSENGGKKNFSENGERSPKTAKSRNRGAILMHENAVCSAPTSIGAERTLLRQAIEILFLVLTTQAF